MTLIQSDTGRRGRAAEATRREWIGLAVIALACVLYVMDLTVLHLAVPQLSADLKPTSTHLLWIIDIYGFMVAGSLITMGSLGDRIGRRRLLLTGAAAFGAASGLAAFSRSAETLIATRALLGVAGATLAPSTLSLIRNMFLDPQQRTTAVSIWITSFSVGAAVGLLLGGLVLEFFWWGAVFLLALPVMALLLALGPRLLPEYWDPAAGRADLPSAALCLLTVLAVIFGLKQMAQDGLGWVPVASILAGLTLGVAFMRRQQHLADPLVDLQLFRVPAFKASLAIYGLGIFLVFGGFLYLPQYLELVHGLSPLEAGLWTLPWALAFIVGSTLTPRVVRRVRPAVVMAGGLALAAVGFGAFTQAGRRSVGVRCHRGWLRHLLARYRSGVHADERSDQGPPRPSGPVPRRGSLRRLQSSAGPSGSRSSAASGSPSTAAQWRVGSPPASRRMLPRSHATPSAGPWPWQDSCRAGSVASWSTRGSAGVPAGTASGRRHQRCRGPRARRLRRRSAATRAITGGLRPGP